MTKDLSTLTHETGRSRKYAREEKPVPKSSIARAKPFAARAVSTTMAKRGLGHHSGFGHFQFQSARRHPVAPTELFEPVREARIGERVDGEVHSHRQVDPAREPPGMLGDGLLQDEGGEVGDDPVTARREG